MDKTAKQTALFFGFLAAAMTHASAQPASFNPAEAQRPAVERSAQTVSPDMATRDRKALGPNARRGVSRG